MTCTDWIRTLAFIGLVCGQLAAETPPTADNPIQTAQPNFLGAAGNEGGIGLPLPTAAPAAVKFEYPVDPLSPLPRNAIPSKTFDVSKNLILAVSEKGDRLMGYSKELEKWTTIALDTGLHWEWPRVHSNLSDVDSNLGYLTNSISKGDKDQNQYIWGYSPLTGGFDKLTLNPNAKFQLQILEGRMLVENGDDVHIFSARTGKWSAPRQPEDDAMPASAEALMGSEGMAPNALQPALTKQAPKANDSTLKVFYLENSNASEVVTLLKQLFQSTDTTFVADDRTNTLMVRGPKEQQLSVEALVRRLDSLPEKVVPNDPGNLGPRLEKTTVDPRNTSQLQSDYEFLEHEAVRIAAELRTRAAGSAPLKAKLQWAVTEAFAVRQKLHLAELAALQQRMAKIQHTIQAREQIREQVIARRIEDLLDPDLIWESKPNPMPSIKSPTAKISKPKTIVNPAELDGEWQLVSTTNQGAVSYPVEQMLTNVRDGQWRSQDQKFVGASSIAINSTAAPKTITITTTGSDAVAGNNAPQVRKGNYRVDGDLMTIAWSAVGLERPVGFDDPTSTIEIWRRLGPSTSPVVMGLTLPIGTEISPLDWTAVKTAATKVQGAKPVALMLEAEQVHQFRLTKITGHPNQEHLLTISFPTPAAARTVADSKRYLPLHLNDEDFEQSQARKSVVKVIYEPTVPPETPRTLQFETIVSTKLDPEIDILRFAGQKGTVLAAVQLSKAQPLTRSGPSELDGHWRLESILGRGGPSYDQEVEVWIRNHQWIHRVEQFGFKSSLILNSDVTPKTLDLISSDGGHQPSIARGNYRLEGNKLVIALSNQGIVRPAGFEGDITVHTWKRMPPGSDLISLHLTSPKGATFTPLDNIKRHSGKGSAAADSKHRLPLQLVYATGKEQRFKISDIPYHQNLAITVTVEFPALTVATRDYLNRNLIPFELDDEDLEGLQTGDRLVKAIYLPASEAGKKQAENPDSYINRQGDKLGVVKGATQRGSVLAVITCSNNSLNESNNYDSQLPPASSSPNQSKANEPPDAAAVSVQEAKTLQLRIDELQQRIDNNRQSIEKVRASSPVDQTAIEKLQQELDEGEQRLKVAIGEHSTKMVAVVAAGNSARQALDVTNAALESAIQANRQLEGTVAPLELQRLQQARDEAATNYAKAGMLLELYRKSVPTINSEKKNKTEPEDG